MPFHHADHALQVFATLRIYAIWNRNIPITLLIFALYMVPVVSNTVCNCFTACICADTHLCSTQYAFATDTIGFFVDPDAGPQCFEMSKLSDGVNSRRRSAEAPRFSPAHHHETQWHWGHDFAS